MVAIRLYLTYSLQSCEEYLRITLVSTIFNKKKSIFTIIINLFKDQGVINLDYKRFLILQSKVKSITQIKLKAQSKHNNNLLKYLEDIISTYKYKTPIAESKVEVKSLNEVYQEKSNRVQYIEKEKSRLEEKKNKALTYIYNKNKLALKQSTLY